MWMRAGARLYYAERHTDKSSASITGTSSTAAIYLSPLLGINDTWNHFRVRNTLQEELRSTIHISVPSRLKQDVKQTNLNLLPWVRVSIFSRYIIRSVVHDRCISIIALRSFYTLLRAA